MATSRKRFRCPCDKVAPGDLYDGWEPFARDKPFDWAFRNYEKSRRSQGPRKPKTNPDPHQPRRSKSPKCCPARHFRDLLLSPGWWGSGSVSGPRGPDWRGLAELQPFLAKTLELCPTSLPPYQVIFAVLESLDQKYGIKPNDTDGANWPAMSSEMFCRKSAGKIKLICSQLHELAKKGPNT